jgi:cyclohexanecarboxylate-CoA ligase/acyl-CoA synthetase
MGAIADAPRHGAAAAEKFRRDGFWRGETVPAALAERAVGAPDAIAAIDGGARLTYGEWQQRAERLAAGLAALGLGRGDVIGVQLPNGVDFLAAYAGIARLGAVISTIHMPYREGEIEVLLGHGGAAAVICGAPSASHDAPATMLGLKRRVATLRHVIVAVPDAPPGALALPDLMGSASAPPPEPAGSDPLVLCFTSGTSAAPKAVLHTHEAMMGNIRAALPRFALAGDDIVLSGAPFTHVFGLGVATLALGAGAANLLLPQFTPEAMARLIADHKATALFGAPAHAAAMLKAASEFRRDLSSLRFACLGGSLLPAAVAAGFEAMMGGGKVTQLFGMTETMMTAASPPGAPISQRHGAIGPALPGYELRVVGADGTPLPASTEGELEVRGAWAAPGYVANAAATAAAFRDEGWFATGDLAVLDPSGVLRIAGRSKDIVNRGGIKINPSDIEALLAEHPALAQAAIVPVPDPVLGERICLVAALRPGASAPTLEEIARFLGDRRVAKLRWPERVVYLPELPMTPTRKIVKRALIERLAAVRDER